MNDNMKIKYFDEELEVYDERRVVNKNTYSITLNYVPSPTRPLTVENGKTILTETNGTPNANQYVLDRENGLLLFNQAMKGKVMTINYSAIGLWCISADKVYTNVDNKGKIVETLEDLMRENRQTIESIKTVGDAFTVITQLQADIDSVTGLVGNIAEGSSVNEKLTQNIESGEGVNATLTNTISSVNNKINEMNTWVNQHENIVNLDNRVDAVETEIPKINEHLDTKIQQLENSKATKQEVGELNSKLNNINEEINRYFILAPYPSGGDDTATLQRLIGSNKTIIFPFGETYKVNSLSVSNISKLKIIGNRARFLKSSGSGAILNLNEVNHIVIEDLEFDYSLSVSSVTNEECCISINNYAYINIISCIFNKFKDVAINLKTAKDSNGLNGGTTSTPCLIEKCKFLNQTNNTSRIYATSILLGADSEYCKILFNEFRNVWTAIRGFGANSLIFGNTIMDCEATFSVDTALIYLYASDSVNSAKHIISNNEINHNTKGVTGIYCVGDKSRNERRYTLINNHILVHGLSGSNNGCAIAIKNADYSLIQGNYSQVQLENEGNILIENSNEVNISANTMQNATGIRATGSTFYETNNMFQECTRKVWCVENSIVLGKTYTVRIKYDTAEIGAESNLENATAQKTGTGTYVLNHNFGHVQYVATAIADNATTFSIIVLKRTATTLEIRCFGQDGSLKNENIMITIMTK